MGQSSPDRRGSGLFRKVGQPFSFYDSATILASNSNTYITNMELPANHFFLPCGLATEGDAPLTQQLTARLRGTCAISGILQDIRLHHNMSLLWIPNAATPLPLKNTPEALSLEVINTLAAAVVVEVSLWGWILPDDLLPTLVPWL